MGGKGASNLRKSKKPIVIASRRSRLARAQAELVGRMLGRLHPKLAVEYRWIESAGDKQQEISLADSDGKGMFVRAIEQALISGEADIAVHSMKDLPSKDTPGMTIAAVTKRQDPRDCLITHHAGVHTIDDLPHAATIGTASPRRAAQLRRIRNDLNIELIRGNVDTRLNKVLEEHRFDATLLAVAGLNRLGLSDLVVHPLDIQSFVPAACQGALAVQCRSNDHVSITRCLPINHAETSAAVHAERQIVRGLGGDCHSPVAVHIKGVEIEGKGGFHIHAVAIHPDGSDMVESSAEVTQKMFGKTVKQILADMRKQGAHRLIRQRVKEPAKVVARHG